MLREARLRKRANRLAEEKEALEEEIRAQKLKGGVYIIYNIYIYIY